jgi:hypothetical protein
MATAVPINDARVPVDLAILISESTLMLSFATPRAASRGLILLGTS